ncbi:MAG: 6-phosphogluconolactonase [Myxococcota bacterium]
MSEALGELRVSKTPGDAQEACAVFVENVIADVVGRLGRAAIAVSGGSTPRPTYARLAVSKRIHWPSVDVYFADERCVPPTHDDSNYRMVRELLGPSVNIVRMEAERKDRETAARDYEELLPKAFDLVLLGMGPDGHTASLFPGKPALRSNRRVLFVQDSPKPPPERITIGPDVVKAAERVVMLVAGADKSEMLARARDEATTVDDVPARLARRGIWFVDEAATKGN